MDRQGDVMTPMTNERWRPTVEDSLVAAIARHARSQPEKLAVGFLDRGDVLSGRLSYAALWNRARAIAAVLSRSLSKGDRVLLVFEPGLAFVESYFGCLLAGLVAVPTCPPANRAESDARLSLTAEDAEPRAILTSPLLSEFSRRLADTLRCTAVVVDEIAGTDPLGEPHAPALDDIAYLQYTSGSTSRPKGVMVTHGNMIQIFRHLEHDVPIGPDGVMVSWLPVFHDLGLLLGLLCALYVGGSAILMPPEAFIQKPVRWLRAISDHRATNTSAPDSAYDMCVDRIRPEDCAGFDLSSLRVAGSGGERVQTRTIDRFSAAFGHLGFSRQAFCPAYGLAEATLTASISRFDTMPRSVWIDQERLAAHEVELVAPGIEGSIEVVSCGGPSPESRFLAVDPETMLPCAAGREGEIWFDGPGVAAGYWRNEEATRHTFGAYLADSGEGPFLRTGDLGFVRDGELFITGRIKDLIIIRGRNIHPEDVEASVNGSHPALLSWRCAAFSTQHSRHERLVVVQEVRRGAEADVDAGEVARAIRRSVARSHAVQTHAVVLVRQGTVARTTSGKVQRQRMRASFLDGTLPVLAVDTAAV
jgi:acyl-CoA synthetase (AMP-forming)/AMP-acid ligase II